jgi:RNA polymerase sigma factor (sigma-70 family)
MPMENSWAGINHAQSVYRNMRENRELKVRHEIFEAAVLPHLDAAFNLARWITGDEALARDAVQTSALRALTYIASLRGDQGRPWFLGIVRNVCMDASREQSARIGDLDVATILEGSAELEHLGSAGDSPEHGLELRATKASVNATLRALPVIFREVLVLREIEDMSYEEIAIVTGVPPGTVMSRLSRARRQFRESFPAIAAKGTT